MENETSSRRSSLSGRRLSLSSRRSSLSSRRSSLSSRRSSLSSGETLEQKQCWVCFGTEDDEFEGNGDWMSPCKCRGSIQWVHQACVQQWVDEKLREDDDSHVSCPQCNTEYIIISIEVNYFVQILNKIDKLTSWYCPYLAAGVVLCTIYWSAASYGAITVMQVIGEEKGMAMMENTDPFILILVLPTIPLGLIFGQIINWEETLLFLVQRYTSRSPLLRSILPTFLYEPISISTDSSESNLGETQTITLCSALVLPTTSIIVGNLLFYKSSYSSIKKTLLGGLVYIAVKGAINIYQKQHNAIKERSRKIVNYPASNDEESHS